MRLATIEQCKKIEHLSTLEYDLSDEILMESAGAIAAREIEQSFFPEIKRGQVAIVCGPGNNGGDGLVLARHLHSAGHRNLILFILTQEGSSSELFKKQLNRVRLQGLKVINIIEEPEKKNKILDCSLVVDAIFGIGLAREITGEHLKTIDIINSVKVPVLSLDTPSGLNCDSGTVSGAIINAHMTLSFGLAKPGFFVAEGPQYVGKLRILPIGFPYEILRSAATTHFVFTEKLARRYLPKRPQTSNKSDHGHVLVMAGSEGMWGAGVLCASSAYRVGAGYVTWASFKKPEVLEEAPEILTTDLSSEKIWSLKKVSAVAIGPGLGVTKQTAEVIERLKKTDWPVVLDADAITACVEFDLLPLPSHWVITPHTGELSKIIKKEVRFIEKNRFESALEASTYTGCHVLLKGFRSVLAYGHRTMVINSGNSALSKAGTGDVLTGMISGFLAQGVDPVQATGTAAYIHGRMADEWVRSGHDRRSLMASDLRNHLPQLMNRLETGALV